MQIAPILRIRTKTDPVAIADDQTVTVVNLFTAEILSTHATETEKNYWRNTQRTPGR